VFEGKAHSFYMPRNKNLTISTQWSVKIAVCGTAADVDTESAVYGPDHVNSAVLGVKPWERDTHFIIDARSNAKRLTIGEAFVTPGNWAGFPPHKHDIDNMPAEGILEEVYYFLFQPEQGFAIQRLYTKDGEIDECYVVKNNELVEFPKGYHTTVGAPGYNTYFLWAMAGQHQGFFRSNDPDHDWVTAVENLVKKNRT
jgi:5-deoxy-glucuronate isomerase